MPSVRPDSQPFESIRQRHISRRALLAASARAGIGAAGLAIVGCSDDSDEQQQAQPDPQSQQQTSQTAQQDQQAQQQSADSSLQQGAQQQTQPDQPADPTGPARGGVMRFWLAVDRHDRWDPHRSRFRYTQAVLSLMYNRLLRPASVSSGELQADLCSLPETPDQLTYIFSLDPNAVFWNREPASGRAVNPEDIRWNIERQRDASDASGVPDPHFFRRASYSLVDSISADDGAVTLTTAIPDATFLSHVHGSPFAWIVNREAADQYGDLWRDDPMDITRSAGSGPYTPRTYDGFQLSLERSHNWWRPDSAYADGIVFEAVDPNGIGSYYDSQLADRADFPLTNEAVEQLRGQYPDHPTYELPLGASVELLAPQSIDPDSPLNDPRVIHAINLSIDRPQLLQRLYDGHGQASGPVPQFLDGWSLSEPLLNSFPGFRNDRAADLVEVQQLIDAAGATAATAPVPLVAADLFEGYFAGAGEAVRSMITDATELDVSLEHRPFADAIEQLSDGERFLFLGWSEVPQQADPTDHWLESLHSFGTRRWSDGASVEVDSLISQMKSTFDLAARQDLCHQIQELLLRGDAPQWQINLVNGAQLGIHQPYFHPDARLFEFAWSTDRLSNAWLETWHEGFPADRELPPLPQATDADG